MKFKKIITVALIFYTFQIFGQLNNNTSLDSCIFYAENNFSILKNNNLNTKISELQNRNYSANFYPRLNFEAKASYQTQSIDINIDTQGLPPGADFNFPSPPLDQYALTLNLSQTIYDGGYTKSLKSLEKVKLSLQNSKNDLSFFNIKQQVNKVYFSILILRKTKEQITNSLKVLQSQYKSLQSGVKNGIVTQDNLDLLSAEQLKIKQKLTEIQENIKSNYIILSELTGKDINEFVNIDTPKDTVLIPTNNRSEFKILDTQIALSDAKSNLLKSKRLPKIGVFATGGYGNPGLTMIKDEWSPYAVIGAKLNWNIWDWNVVSREKQIQQISKSGIENQKEAFNQSLNVQTSKLSGDIEKIKKLTEYDLKIIKLHNKICNSFSTKLLNGTVTSLDYISSLNKLEQAKIQYEIHKLQIIQLKYNYLITTGNL